MIPGNWKGQKDFTRQILVEVISAIFCRVKLCVIQVKRVFESPLRCRSGWNETSRISRVSKGNKSARVARAGSGAPFGVKLREEKSVNYSECQRSLDPRNHSEERNNPRHREEDRGAEEKGVHPLFFPPFSLFALVFSLFPYPSLFPRA